ncbi:MAG: signal recognition particle protein [Gammaproteobacteria bacterium]|nr:MAG: signal recognition particle protein [Gammaproteobacteria bacterium]
MFETLSSRLGRAVDALKGRGRITEENIADTVRQVRMALLEADVALPVVKSFIARVRERALGQEVTRSLSPGQAFVKIIRDEMVVLLGGAAAELDLRAQPPVVILLVGLQGAGKTTTAGKLARWLAETQRKSVMLASADIYRPAAIDQLERLAEQVGAKFWRAPDGTQPAAIATGARQEARLSGVDVLILDTAGRLHIDEGLMSEAAQVQAAVTPQETLFVVDSMAGQDAVNAARAFHEALTLSGVVLTKIDGDARGGAALSVREVTGVPIKLVGRGEKLDALEAFHPDRMASRILGMGDVLSLVEEVERKVDQDKARALAGKLKKGKGFDLVDLRDQLGQMLEMGGMDALLDKLPSGLGGGALKAAQAQFDDRQVRRQIAIIDSMTPTERRQPKLINGSRKRRIASGAGLSIPDVNRLLKQHAQMQKMMKKMTKGGGLKNMMRGLGAGRPMR